MTPEKRRPFLAHALGIPAHPDQVAAGVQVAVLSVRDAVQRPLRVSVGHERVGAVVEDQRRTTHRIGLQSGLATRVGPVVLDPGRLLRTPKLRLDERRDECARRRIIDDLHVPLAEHERNVERFIQSIQQECLDKFVAFDREHMDHLVSEYVEHYHHERPQQAKGNWPLMGDTLVLAGDGNVVCRERLGGVLRHYYRRAA